MMCVRCATCATRDACGPHIHRVEWEQGLGQLLDFYNFVLSRAALPTFTIFYLFIRGLSRDKRANIARATYKTSLVFAPHSFCRFSYSFTDAANSLALRPAPGEHATCLAAHTPPKLSSDTRQGRRTNKGPSDVGC